ncbi:MAG: alpha/beta hydrolase [Rhodocyclales bacterium]|nr:alpha/beta hydrolase [Rhodocyclales bacterium]
MTDGRMTIQGRRLEYHWIEPAKTAAPTLIFLHEGLGSVGMWKDFPARLAATTGCGTLIYSRIGHGKSDRLPAPHQVDYMHVQALEVLPEIRAHLGLGEPVLVGHSDGGSIALIHAGAARWPVKGLILEAPHVFVEDVSVASIAQAKAAYRNTDLPQKLGRYHEDPDGAFWGWNDIWLHPEFRNWNIEGFLPAIRCPMLAIQGFDDEYGTMAQLEAIERQVSGPVELVKLADCGHSPHRDQPEATLQAMLRFIGRLS